MDFSLGTRRWVEDVEDRGFTELGLQGREGMFLGGTPGKGYIGAGQRRLWCSNCQEVADKAPEELSKANERHDLFCRRWCWPGRYGCYLCILKLDALVGEVESKEGGLLFEE